MLKFEHINYAFDSTPVLRDVNFTAQRGEVTCLIGPSGCGKTTLLKLAAGLLESQDGRISLDGTVLSQPSGDLAPENRPVGLVFQEGALFPHLNVAENVAFGLAGSTQEKSRRAEALLSSVGLNGLQRRYPHTLSGGQQQRVALARALAPEPAVLLFDEPYANLDVHRRTALREQARELVRRTQVIGLFVTHDPDEVLELADHIVVMEAGRILQSGSPTEIYDNPETTMVAALFGQSQPVKSELTAAHLHTPFGQWSRDTLANTQSEGLGEGRVTLMVRPGALTVTNDVDGLSIVDLRLGGALDLLQVRADDGTLIRVSIARPHRYRVGDKVRLDPSRGSLFAFPA